ncbi:MAG: helix-turn-helix domain-containing protein [Candidatus Omnitrophica bacterium]|nr:helix-turn-helix domain-containing protein [Candidatus Omnitrophota bacterium]
MEPGDRIKSIRKNMGLTQAEFGESLGYSHGYIADLERNRQKPSREFLEKLNEVFGISADYILYGSSDQAEKIDAEKTLRGAFPPAFIARLKKDISSADDKFFSSLETPREIIEEALRGKRILSRKSVIELAIKLKQPVYDYLILAEYIPEEMKILIKNKGLVGIFRKMSSLSARELDEVVDTISKILKPYLRRK